MAKDQFTSYIPTSRYDSIVSYRIYGILEQDHVVCLETHGSRKLVFWKHVLGEEHHAHVVRSFRKQVSHRPIGLLHEVVDH